MEDKIQSGKAAEDSTGVGAKSSRPARARGFKRHPLAIAWNEWLESEQGYKCTSGSASGVYLKNRLQSAFMAGAEAGEKSVTH